MRDFKSANCMTCHPRQTPVVIVGLGGLEWCEGGPHKDEVDVGTTVMTATRGLLELSSCPGWNVASELQ